MPDGPMYATSDNHSPDSFARRANSRPNSSHALPPLPGQQPDIINIAQLQRHPTGRTLPTPQSDSDSYDENAQEQMYRDIEATVGGMTMSRQQISQPMGPMSADLLDNELEDLRRMDRQGSINPTADVVTPTQGQGQGMYEFNDDSDAEAAAGLEAMRLAEEQDSRRGSGEAFTSYNHSRNESRDESKNESSDSDYAYAGMDLGGLGGGYEVSMSYGNDLAAHSEAQDVSRPLPSTADLKKPEAHEPAPGLGGMTDYSIPGGNQLHPFPAYGGSDAFGTGGLQRSTSRDDASRRSFDEGDERSVGGDSGMINRSDSESPYHEDYPEMFYHPGIGNRPLPAVPVASLTENKTPQLQPAGSYRQGQQYQQQYQGPQKQPWHPPDGPDSYIKNDLLDPATQFVPRSASLTSHSSTPVVIPPARSRTDAEERQARQRANRGIGSGLDGYDAGTPQSGAPLDLPMIPQGRRKKVTAQTVRSSDYKRCEEPWALSKIVDWLKDMCGGEAGDAEADLRTKTMTDLLIALFTHKVPTMNTADAEVISANVVASMLNTGVLVRDEEWVRFGTGTMNGVLWQLTGTGCYAPKLHESETSLRCYSHHCGRTLKRINLHAQKLKPAEKGLEWHEFYKVSKEQMESKDKKEVQRQNNLHEIVKSEDKFQENLDVLRVIYRDDLQTWQPPIINPQKLPRFIQAVFGRVEAVKKVNMDHLLAQLKYRQREQGPWVAGYSDIFREWIRRAKQVYLDYAAGFPNADYLVRKEMERNLLFSQFLARAQQNPLSERLDWRTFLFAPIARLQRYVLLLKEVLKHSYIDNEEKANLQIAIEEVNAVTLECDAKVAEELKKVQMAELHAKLFLRPGMERVELQLDHLGRELIHQGDLQRTGANRFTWLETRAILFDHYLVLAKTVTQRDSAGQKKKEMYDVSKLVSRFTPDPYVTRLMMDVKPIPMQLLVLESTNDDPVVKSSMKIAVTSSSRPAAAAPTVGGGTSRASTASDRPLLDHSGTTSSLNTLSKVDSASSVAGAIYPFRIKHLGKSEVYTLYANSASARQEWCEKIILAKERHAASLFAQNAEPFRLRILADTAFAVEPQLGGVRSTTVAIRGTPLDRAVRDMEREYGHARPGPVCRAQVNCATSFTVYGKNMIAVGTDYGVYTSVAGNPREWTRAITAMRVTQIAVLEEFSLCLVISDKALIAYHLDVVVPISSSFAPPANDSARRAPQKLSGSREVSFFATARVKDRTLVYYKKREGISSTFKVLEPIIHKSSEKKSRLFRSGRGGIGLGAATTDYFREFDEFYIPAESWGINLFTSYIAVSTQRGFELLTLDKKIPMSIPLMGPGQGTQAIASRLSGQRPLGMFRLSQGEFLCAYEECGVYVDNHGEVSRAVVLEFVGKATRATLWGRYLVLVGEGMVEVRNVENGRLRQVIAGRDVRLLDTGSNGQAMVGKVAGGGLGLPREEQRTLKIAMAHPEWEKCQLVVELVLNEGQRE